MPSLWALLPGLGGDLDILPLHALRLARGDVRKNPPPHRLTLNRIRVDPLEKRIEFPLIKSLRLDEDFRDPENPLRNFLR